MFGQDTRTWGPARIIFVQFIYFYGVWCLSFPLINLLMRFLFPEDAVDIGETTVVRVVYSLLVTAVFVPYHYYQVNKLKDQTPEDDHPRETPQHEETGQG